MMEFEHIQSDCKVVYYISNLSKLSLRHYLGFCTPTNQTSYHPKDKTRIFKSINFESINFIPTVANVFLITGFLKLYVITFVACSAMV